MKRLIFLLLLTMSLSAQNWVLVHNDGRTRHYVASDQITRDDGGLKFFVQKIFTPPLQYDGKIIDETVTMWWVKCSSDQYKLGPTFEFRNGQRVGVQPGLQFSWDKIQRNTGIPLAEDRNRAFDYVCRNFR